MFGYDTRNILPPWVLGRRVRPRGTPKQPATGDRQRVADAGASMNKANKAKSVRQQRLFGMVRAVQKGEMSPPSSQVAEMAGSMSRRAVKDYAETKHKGLPVKEKSAQSMTKVAAARLITNWMLLKQANILPVRAPAAVRSATKPKAPKKPTQSYMPQA